MIDLLTSKIRHFVEAGGARYDGVMELPGYRLVLFTSPRSGSTLAIKLDDLLAGGRAAIKVHLAESDAKFGLGAAT